jgi:acyl-CoA thioester hydrolase
VIASVTALNFSNAGFDIYYKLEKKVDEVLKTIALAKTGMIGYDYARKKIAAIPEKARVSLTV